MSTMLFPEGRIPMVVEAQDGRFSANPVLGNIHRLVTLPQPDVAVRRAA